ncbi:CubicO group peptidase (beta-lactamase class C family) [Georgenia soli]|uniref:CubicO group peptidase (Beta-lactamase class C family) n=1 Tax=Georgenia soli TaxID=638953 RepID=A0A2A9EH28_9MICO|nr:serine hydrolase domain-containing protein [Georgenia soli]PFG38224.1 CubicO group peptidase (beta-lactamase class C family) [Georgenia soli]
MPRLDTRELTTAVGQVLNRWPTAGLAVAAVRGGELVWSHHHGVADVASGTPVDEDTVFRVGSVTKTLTAVAVMQLWERGVIDLDAPVADYLRAFELVPGRADLRPPTVRHLLTHTAGVRAVRTAPDLLRPVLGWGAPPGRAPSPAEYYRGGLRFDVQPGTKWAYTNHGFTALGQLVEDVKGVPFASYLREHVLDPLGMDSSDVVRSDRVLAHLATGYELRRRGLHPVEDLEVVTAGGGALYSTARDLARYAAALLGGGANGNGRVLRPESLALMFQPHHQPDPRVPGVGLGFYPGTVGGHRTVGHDGIWKGFLADLLLAPDDGVGVVALGNTSSFDPRGAPVPAAEAVLRQLLGVSAAEIRTDVPQRPATWGDLCGRYSLGPGPLLDPQPRMVLGSAVEVLVRRGRLVVRGRRPVPAVRRGLRLHPDGEDPDLFRVDLTEIGPGVVPVAFSRGPDGRVTAMHTGLLGISYPRLPDLR